MIMLICRVNFTDVKLTLHINIFLINIT